MGTYTTAATATFNGNNLDVTNSVGTKADLSNIFLTNGIGKEGDDVTMYCMYEGSATVNIFTYYKLDDSGDWQAVDKSLIRLLVTYLSVDNLASAKTLTGNSAAKSGSTLQILNVDNDDEGLYKCSVTSISNIRTDSKQSNLQLISWSLPEIKMLVETGETAMITCTFSGPSVPEIEGHTFVSSAFSSDQDALLYSKDSSSLTSNSITRITTTAVFSKVIRKNGPFKCHATFKDEISPGIQSELGSGQVEILAASIELGTHESSLPIYEGVAFTFICQYSFETAGTVTISPSADETVTDDSRENFITTGFKNGQFGKITSTSFTGPYICSVEIEGHTISKQLDLKIISIPAVPNQEEVTVQYSDYDWLTCTVTSDLPLFSVSWYTKEDGKDQYVTTHR